MSSLDTNQQRGLVIMSALINFVDWLDRERLLRPQLSDKERAKLVLKFFDAHQPGENYFMQAEQIAEILGVPFESAREEREDYERG